MGGQREDADLGTPLKWSESQDINIAGKEKSPLRAEPMETDQLKGYPGRGDLKSTAGEVETKCFYQ